MKEPEVTLDLAIKHGLTEAEYRKIIDYLGRTPTFAELGVYSVMWSEHCSYKSSIKYLKTFPRDGERVLAGAGEENAGAMDIGDGKAVVFKIESHNHPSALEPFQGAATGVGGILRDVFSMGARPIAALNSLRFGELGNPKQQHLFNGVVEGIARYGNCFGVPTVGGEVVFDRAYAGNCLVNAMAVGIVDVDKMMPAKAGGIGNPVFILGASTGRDGIHGATFASVELSDQSAEDRSSVQIGDPFLEKLLMEATLEIIEKGFAVGIQDMGAAGICCSSSETAESGGVGIRLNLNKVPMREDGMTPYEILLSESQERMLVIGKAEFAKDIIAVAEKWDLHIEQIGEVIEGDRFVCDWHDEAVCDVPASSLVLGGGAPVYDRPFAKPAYIEKIHDWQVEGLRTENLDPQKTLLDVLSMPTIASKRWVYEQYDHQVCTDTAIVPGYDAALLRIKGTDKFIAASTDCNGRYCYLDPYMGAMQAVAESARNVIATGAKPIGITNCLNFPNPEIPERYWLFIESIRGIGDACREYIIPVTGGNVSFYNESPDGPIYPTPTIGMIGLLEGEENIIRAPFIEGSIIYLLGATDESEFGGSALQKLIIGDPKGTPPKVDMSLEIAHSELIREAKSYKMITSCHDISDGGLAIALAECCIWGNVGAKINLPSHNDAVRFLFTETQARYLIGIKANMTDDFEHIIKQRGLIASNIGTVTGTELVINSSISIAIEKLKCKYYNAIPELMKGKI
jgi:phosphoribosylformylglycinamidine synthase